MAAIPDPALLDKLAASGAVWRGTSGTGLRVESSGIATLDARLPGGGWPAGALSELLIPAHGIGEVSLALPAVARLTQAGRHAAFVAPPHLPYAPAMAQAGVVLERTLIVEPKTADEAVWTVEQLLRTSAYGAVLAWVDTLRDADQRRLQLAAETGNSLAFLYRPQRVAGSSSVAALRLKLERENRRLSIEILKARGGRPGARFYADQGESELVNPLSPGTGERASSLVSAVPGATAVRSTDAGPTVHGRAFGVIASIARDDTSPLSRKRERGTPFEGAA